MKTILKNIDIEVDLTPEVLAAAFANLDNRDQALFFNSLAVQVSTWDGTIDMQMCDVSDSGVLNKDGRHIMQVIGNYSQQN